MSFFTKDGPKKENRTKTHQKKNEVTKETTNSQTNDLKAQKTSQNEKRSSKLEAEDSKRLKLAIEHDLKSDSQQCSPVSTQLMNEAEPSPMSSILQKRQEKLKKKQELIKQLGIPNDIEKIYREKASKQKKVIFQSIWLLYYVINLEVEKKQYYFRSIKESPPPIPEQHPSDIFESEYVSILFSSSL